MCALCSNLTLQQAGSNNIVYVGWEANMGARFMGKQPICIWRQGFLNACLLHGLIGCISSNNPLPNDQYKALDTATTSSWQTLRIVIALILLEHLICLNSYC
jgi:hypothetical protein